MLCACILSACRSYRTARPARRKEDTLAAAAAAPPLTCMPTAPPYQHPWPQRSLLRNAAAAGLRVGGVGIGGNPLSLPQREYAALRPGMKR
jgi:hypothetical protein